MSKLAEWSATVTTLIMAVVAAVAAFWLAENGVLLFQVALLLLSALILVLGGPRFVGSQNDSITRVVEAVVKATVIVASVGIVVLIGVPNAWSSLPNVLTEEVKDSFAEKRFDNLERSGVLGVRRALNLDSDGQMVLLSEIKQQPSVQEAPSTPLPLQRPRLGSFADLQVEECCNTITTLKFSDVAQRVFGSIANEVSQIGWFIFFFICFSVAFVLVYPLAARAIIDGIHTEEDDC